MGWNCLQNKRTARWDVCVLDRKDRLRMDGKISIDQLVVEITRKCNMACAHCLRGDTQDLDIQPAFIDALLENVKEIYNVTFTGGEPALNPGALEYFLSRCQALGVLVHGFYIVTNGKVVPERFLAAVDALDVYAMACMFKPKDIPIQGDDAIHMVSGIRSEYTECAFGLALSLDDYHEPIPAGNIMRLMTRQSFCMDKMQNSGTSNLLRMGRAEHMADAREMEPLEVNYGHDYSQEVGEQRIENLYLNAKGGLLYHCDLSYEKQERMVYANVMDKGWVQSLAKNSKAEVEKVGKGQTYG